MKEPTETDDGLEEYRCAECGKTEASQPIPAAMYYVKNLIESIENAPENGIVENETGVFRCYTQRTMKALRDRPDVSLKTTFTDEEGNRKSFTIPAGQALDDGEQFYGYTYLGNLYGWEETQE